MTTAMVPAASEPNPADARRQTMARLIQRSGGTVTPEQVLEEAKKPDSPLHDLFRWDNEQAGHSYRLMQAAAIIQRFRVYVTRNPSDPTNVRVSVLKPIDATPENTTRARGLVSLSTDRNNGGARRELAAVLADPILRRQYVEDVKAELRAVREKHQYLTELSSIWNTIGRLK